MRDLGLSGARPGKTWAPATTRSVEGFDRPECRVTLGPELDPRRAAWPSCDYSPRNRARPSPASERG